MSRSISRSISRGHSRDALSDVMSEEEEDQMRANMADMRGGRSVIEAHTNTNNLANKIILFTMCKSDKK